MEGLCKCGFGVIISGISLYFAPVLEEVCDLIKMMRHSKAKMHLSHIRHKTLSFSQL